MIREATRDELDVPVSANWLHSFRGSPFAGLVAREKGPEYFDAAHRRLIRAILNRSRVLVDERNGLVAGWLAHEGDILHYIYVRGVFRTSGVAKGLVAAVGDIASYTHASRHVEFNRVPKGWVYDPYLLFR